MKTLLAMALCLALGLSLMAGCGGGGSAISQLVPNPSPSAGLTISACFAGACGSPTAPPVGQVGQPYGYLIFCIPKRYCNSGVLLEVFNGVGPYAWSSSSLPRGLNLGPFCNSSGCSFPEVQEISGVPTTAGTYNVLVAVSDSESPPKEVSANYTITIAP
jgi:hypothetical protein